MSQKEEGEEPCPAETIARCPVATFNPSTERAFCEKTIMKVLLKDCYDFDPAKPWRRQHPLQKRFLPDDIKTHRSSMIRNIQDVQEHGQNVAWWARNVVWIDPCASILARSHRQYLRMRRAELGSKQRLISDDAKMYSRNLRQPKECLKQNSFEAERISWLVVLARGVAHVEMLPEDWTVDGEGLASAVAEVPRMLRRMLGDDAPLPRTLFTDRGTGLYAPGGQVVRKYAAAVATASLRLYWGADAKQQSPDMGDLLLHETVVAWFRSRMRRERPVVRPWEETRAQWATRAARCMRAVNAECDVAGLCREFPARLQACLEQGGDRLRK
jgi:hypothetical protein